MHLRTHHMHHVQMDAGCAAHAIVAGSGEGPPAGEELAPIVRYLRMVAASGACACGHERVEGGRRVQQGAKVVGKRPAPPAAPHTTHPFPSHARARARRREAVGLRAPGRGLPGHAGARAARGAGGRRQML